MARKSAEPHCPDRGELIWLEFDPQAGREQAGRRPALVLSPFSYNQASALALICPITSRVRGYPFESLLPPESPMSGVVMSDQVKSLSWVERRAVFIAHAPAALVLDVRAKIRALLEQ